MGESVFSRLRQWVSNTPLRSLEQAYEAALRIKAIEDQHFHGGSIGADGEHGQNVSRYFQIQLRQQLSQIELRLAEFRASSTFSRLPDPNRNGSGLTVPDQDKEPHPPDASDPESNGKSPENGHQSRDPSILEKLQFIDQVTSRYKRSSGNPKSITPAPDPPEQPQQLAPNSSDELVKGNPNNGNAPVASKTGILPRSILRTASQIRRELSSQAEEELVRDYRNARTRTVFIAVGYFAVTHPNSDQKFLIWAFGGSPTTTGSRHH
ncbi:MAG: hypothetical protein Q6M04_09760 [Thermostichus sp. BF3_bins_97]